MKYNNEVIIIVVIVVNIVCLIIYYIVEMDTTIYTSKIALSLSDLAATPKNASSISLISLASPYNNGNNNGNNKYEQELERLMNKQINKNTSNTQYDKAMRIIIEKKVNNNKIEQEYNSNIKKIDISRLMESRKEAIKAKNELISYPDRSERLEDLSKPLERRIYKKNNDLGKTQQLYELFNKSTNTKTFSD